MTNKEQLNLIMAEFITNLEEERDAWQPSTEVAMVLSKHLNSLHEVIQVHRTISLNKGE
tara:strand:+ start:9544 stop:9720 length:177 start_codon:yes stop_codon:yes gene_type:complete